MFTSLASSRGLDKHSLNFVNAYSHLSVQSRPLLFFITNKKGLHLLIDRERNQLRTAILPIKFYIFFMIMGDFIFIIALI